MTIASTITSRRHMFAGSALTALATAILMPAAALAQTADHRPYRTIERQSRRNRGEIP